MIASKLLVRGASARDKRSIGTSRIADRTPMMRMPQTRSFITTEPHQNSVTHGVQTSVCMLDDMQTEACTPSQSEVRDCTATLLLTTLAILNDTTHTHGFSTQP